MNAPLPWKSRLLHFGICRTPKGGSRPSHQSPTAHSRRGASTVEACGEPPEPQSGHKRPFAEAQRSSFSGCFIPINGPSNVAILAVTCCHRIFFDTTDCLSMSAVAYPAAGYRARRPCSRVKCSENSSNSYEAASSRSLFHRLLKRSRERRMRFSRSYRTRAHRCPVHGDPGSNLCARRTERGNRRPLSAN